MTDSIKQIVHKHGDDTSKLISILQEIQKCMGFLSKEAIFDIADSLNISESTIYGVATFYTQFRFNPPGKYQIKTCQGTACHVRASKGTLEALEKELGIRSKETTEDRLFSLETVACMGCCALAPVIAVDDTVYGACTPAKIRNIIEKLRESG